MERLVLFLFYFCFIFTCSCVSMFRSEHAPLSVSGADGESVTYNGTTFICPAQINVPTGQDCVLSYASGEILIESHTKWYWVVASVALNASHGIFTVGISAVIGITYDFHSGALKELEKDAVVIPPAHSSAHQQ